MCIIGTSQATFCETIKNNTFNGDKMVKIGGTPYYEGGARLMIRMIFNRHLRDLMKVIL